MSGLIVTDMPMPLTRPSQDRMPVVLEKVDIGPWLNGTAGIEVLRRADKDRVRHVAGVEAAVMTI